MLFGQLFNLITMDSTSACYHNTPCSYGYGPLFAVVDIFRVSSMQKFLTNFRSYVGSNDQKMSSTKLLVDKFSDWSTREELDHPIEEGDGISREDVKKVMGKLGIFCSPESDQLKEWFDSSDLSGLFDEKEPSFEEIKQAFDVFDENGDGFIEAQELQKILRTLGFFEANNLDICQTMIKTHDTNGDGKLDFKEFVKFMEKCFSS